MENVLDDWFDTGYKIYLDIFVPTDWFDENGIHNYYRRLIDKKCVIVFRNESDAVLCALRWSK